MGGTFSRHFQLARLGDLDIVIGLVPAVLGHVLDLVDYVVAFDDLAEDDVAPVEPGGDGGRDEELGAVGIGAGVSHA